MYMTEGLSDAVLVESLSTGCRGRVIGPDHSEYDTVRQLYNAMIDKRPS
jgi:hypothetical protein